MKKTLLIVDDEPRTRQGLKKTLEVWAEGKYEILSAESAQQAMKILGQQKISLLITDISMPEMTGLQMVKTLKENNQSPVVIVISAYPEFSYAQEAIQLGVLSYLLKPIMKRKLIEEVEKALEVGENLEKAGILKKVVDEKLAHLKIEDQKEGSLIKKAMEYVDAHVDSQITLTEAAAHVNLSTSYFSVLFKEKANMNFSEYVTRTRLQKAKNLLISSDLPVAQIAEDVGYTTSKYFIKLFKEYEGVTPSQYRKSATIRN
ncbi:response regulator transcription factor [Bacillus taeanensis]|uniref:DNA-binding response regulator n=1 Tax=Bacillus taeanensis TaxID=273032 RepID=A0A366XUC9_9BACI|nr:response regulator [Bacillus taeanensis]RBW69742.1 DNA-binding response regulator [Bacillus taeanensis]